MISCKISLETSSEANLRTYDRTPPPLAPVVDLWRHLWPPWEPFSPKPLWKYSRLGLGRLMIDERYLTEKDTWELKDLGGPRRNVVLFFPLAISRMSFSSLKRFLKSFQYRAENKLYISEIWKYGFVFTKSSCTLYWFVISFCLVISRIISSFLHKAWPFLDNYTEFS